MYYMIIMFLVENAWDYLNYIIILYKLLINYMLPSSTSCGKRKKNVGPDNPSSGFGTIGTANMCCACAFKKLSNWTIQVISLSAVYFTTFGSSSCCFLGATFAIKANNKT